MTEWLFSSETCAVTRDFAGGEVAHFEHGSTHASVEETQVFPGIWLYRSEASGRSRFSIDIAGDAQSGGRIVMGSMLSGSGIVSMAGCGEHRWRDEGRSFALTPIGRDVRYEIDAERGWRNVTVRLEAEALDFLGEDCAPPDLIRGALEGRLDDIADMTPLPSAIRVLGHTLLRSPYGGTMQKLFRQGKVLELLAHQMSAFGEGTEETNLTSRELAKVRMARDRLLFDLRDPPDLETLARDVGLPAKRLNRGFRMVYGMTAFAYLRDARLDAARRALEEGTSMPLKQLAWELGYGQVSNFVTAFRRRFGVTPGSYRLESGDAYARRD